MGQLSRLLHRRIWLVGLLACLALVLAACPGASQPAQQPAPTEAPAQEESAAPTATPEPEEEPTATPAPEEEPTATPEPEPEATAPPEEEAMPAEMDMGEYVMTIVGCGCHFNRDLGGLAGGRDFDVGNGVVYAKNITPDEETGIGAFSVDEIVAMLRIGALPDGTQLHPIMPYMRMSVLSDLEAESVANYLLGLDPIMNEVPPRELSSEPAPYTPAVEPPATPPEDPIARGEQLVTLANCGGCHTPSSPEGGKDMSMLLAGNMLRGDEWAPNLTPDEETGLGSWTVEQIATFLQTGMYPDGSQVEGAMESQISRRFHVLTDEDAMAIAQYLKSLPPIVNAKP